MKKLTTVKSAMGIVAIAILLSSLLFFDRQASTLAGHSSLQQKQTEFVTYVNTVQLQDKVPVYESSGPLCSKSSNNFATDCTLSKTFIYKLEGNYRDEGKKIFAHLKSKGFDFRANDKYKDQVTKKLADQTIAGNLSNTGSIIVDLYGRDGIRVRVLIGERGRTLPYASSQAMEQLSSKQLIAGLKFYNP